MSIRWTLKAWVALSALAVLLMFATVAAEAMLQGTRPPAALVETQLGASLCPEATRFTTI